MRTVLTLEALRSRSVSQRRKLKVLKEQEKTLAGKIMIVVEAFNHRPVTTSYTTNSKANDKTLCDQLLERLPIGGLPIFDLGFFKFPWFDAFLLTKRLLGLAYI